MQFLVLTGDLAAHVHTKFLRKGGEIDVSLLLRVKDVAHERGDFSLGDVDFICQQVLLKVFVGDETISILVELPKDVVHLVLAVEDTVLDRAHDITQAPCFRLVLGAVEFCGFDLVKAFIDESGGRVGSRSLATQVTNYLLLVLCEHQIRNVRLLGMALRIVYERGHETFQVLLAKFLIEHFLVASV